MIGLTTVFGLEQLDKESWAFGICFSDCNWDSKWEKAQYPPIICSINGVEYPPNEFKEYDDWSQSPKEGTIDGVYISAIYKPKKDYRTAMFSSVYHLALDVDFHQGNNKFYMPMNATLINDGSLDIGRIEGNSLDPLQPNTYTIIDNGIEYKCRNA